MDIKECFTQNLIFLRKSLGITQAELAEKLNYSDKSVSKWERGEGIPDVYTLKTIADFFGVSIDNLISKPLEKKPSSTKILPKSHAAIAVCSVTIAWLVAVITFVGLNIFFSNIKNTWLIFVCAIPVSFIILVCLTAVWKKELQVATSTSLLSWSLILSVYLTLVNFTATLPASAWKIFLIGIPIQIMIAFWFYYKKLKKKK